MSKTIRVAGWSLIAAGPVIFLLAVEGCVRLFGIAPWADRDAAVPAWLDDNILVKDARWMELLSSSGKDLRGYYGTYEWDRYLFYRLKPNLAVPLTDVLAPPGAREKTRWTLRTNAKGFPGRAIPYGSHPGVFRIVCMGDSSTFGWGVESEESYPSVLEAILGARHPDRRIEVVNLGICGYSSLQGLVLLERETLRYEPEVITFSYGSNDWSKVPEPFDEVYRRNASWIGALRALAHRSQAYSVYASFLTRALPSGKEAAGPKAGEDPEAMPWNVGPEKSRGNLGDMAAVARGAGAEPIYVANCTPGEMALPMKEAAAAAGAPFLDAKELLTGEIGEVRESPRFAAARARTASVYGKAALAEHPELEVFLADGCHPNPVGQLILAERLAAIIEAGTAFGGGPPVR